MNILPSLLYSGSVKNIRGEVSAENLLFEFTDRYSVFDWGEMPDHIEGKGLALSVMGKMFFSYLSDPLNWIDLFDQESIRSTFDQSYLDQLKKSKLYSQYCHLGLPHHAKLDDNSIEWNSPLMEVKRIDILKPEIINSNYNYDKYKTKPINTLVPLEVIFRIGLPKGNSLSKRLGEDVAKWKSYGVSVVPQNNELLKIPLVDFSTKLEKGDRYLDYIEVQSLASLNETEFSELQEMTHLIALNLFVLHHQMDLELWDGKIEVAFISNTDGSRSFMLVDSIGIDELRLKYKGKSFSKEFLRESYKNSQWYNDLEASKNKSGLHGGDFKEICLNIYQSKPLKLETMTKLRAEAVYKSYCNTLCKKLDKELPFDAEFTLAQYSLRYL